LIWTFDLPSTEEELIKQVRFWQSLVKKYNGNEYSAGLELIRQIAIAKARRGDIKQGYCVVCGQPSTSKLDVGHMQRLRPNAPLPDSFFVTVCFEHSVTFWSNLMKHKKMLSELAKCYRKQG